MINLDKRAGCEPRPAFNSDLTPISRSKPTTTTPRAQLGVHSMYR